ncbi:MAG TPA: xanthine dehydrogenase family protein subunit M [Acidimicrobiia bacterium]|nr:xanthine dehydrogenase family protein subunit M [Acidimicrobiia bacterium]
MTWFEYQRPQSLGEASDLLRKDDSVALAGGTDLLVALRHRAVRPALVVDLKSVSDIAEGIEVEGDRLRIGGRVVMSRLTRNQHVGRHFPALAQAAAVVGSVQIRNRATLAGNLCNASPAADTAPALLAYGATVIASRPDTTRSIPVEEFFTGPGTTVLERGEIVTAVELPIPPTTIGSAFARVTRRRGVDLASVSLACILDPSGRARFGFGAVGPTPLLAESTFDELATDEGWSRLLAVTSPITDVRAGAEYRRAMLQVHSRRAFQAASEQLRAAT